MKMFVRCVVSAMLAVFTLSQTTQGEKPTMSENLTGGWRNRIEPPTAQAAPVPEHVIYGFLFNRTARFNSSMSRQLVRTSTEKEANLTDEQILALADIALACAEQLQQQDAKARQIIAAFRARFPDKQIPPGVPLPPPPPELKLLQAERNAIILRARNRLREAFGEEVFKRFDEAVKRRTAVKAQ